MLQRLKQCNDELERWDKVFELCGTQHIGDQKALDQIDRAVQVYATQEWYANRVIRQYVIGIERCLIQAVNAVNDGAMTLLIHTPYNGGLQLFLKTIYLCQSSEGIKLLLDKLQVALGMETLCALCTPNADHPANDFTVSILFDYFHQVEFDLNWLYDLAFERKLYKLIGDKMIADRKANRNCSDQHRLRFHFLQEQGVAPPLTPASS